MKKERNCGGNAIPYPVYPSYPGMMMNQGMMPNVLQMPMNTINPNAFSSNQNYMMQPNMSNSIEQQLSNLTSQVNSLERRIISLESLIGSPTSKYNNSNYQVM